MVIKNFVWRQKHLQRKKQDRRKEMVSFREAKIDVRPSQSIRRSKFS